MGYTTKFSGRFTLTPPLTDEQFYILKGYAEDEHSDGYCQWVPTKDRAGIEWDGVEKFYDYKEWIDRVVSKYLGRWGVKLGGEVRWSGEDTEDVGVLDATSGVVVARKLETAGTKVTCPKCRFEFRTGVKEE